MLYRVLRDALVPGLENSHQTYARLLGRHVAEAGAWLDLGCGHAFTPDWLPGDRARLSGRAVGLDRDAAALHEHAGLRAKVVGDAAAVPFAAETFDLVTANMVLEHVEAPPQMFREIARVLRPGGTALIHTPNAAGYTTLAARIIPPRWRPRLAAILHGRQTKDVYPTHYRGNTRRAIEDLARRSGLETGTIAPVLSSPLLLKIPPLLVLEMLWIRLLRRARLAPLRPVLIAVLHKPATEVRPELPPSPRALAVPGADTGILQVVLSLSPGGTERLVVEIVRRLREQYRVAVCCLDQPGEWGEMLRGEGTPVVALNRPPGFTPTLARQLAEVAREHRATILHCHQYSPFVYGTLARLFDRRLHVLFTEHGRLNDQPPSRKRRLANFVLARIPDGIYSVSTDLRRHMIAEGFAAGRVGVVVNGTDPGTAPDRMARHRARDVLGLPQDAFVVGTAGRLDPVKDLVLLVRAFGAYARADSRARLVVIGDGGERQALESEARAAGIAGRVHFAGHRSDVRELLPAFDVYVNSSIFEGISLTMLEAMAAERPVIATAVGGTPEVVLDGVTGVLLPPRNATALARALGEAAQKPDRFEAYGRAGRRRVCAQFTLDRMVNTYASAYQRLQDTISCAS